MDHNRALKLQAVERYLLGGLTPEERDSFEEHFFSCAECAGAVRAATVFRANAREVLREPVVPERESRWFAWPSLIPVAASVMLLGVVVYQNTIVIPPLRAPQSLPVPVTLDGVTRGSLPQIEEGQPLDFLMAAPLADAGGVVLELDSESGNRLIRGSGAIPVPDRPYHAYFPGRYRAGRYLVIVRDAASGHELERNEFEIIPKEAHK